MAADPRSVVYFLRLGDAPAVEIGVTVNLPLRIKVLSENFWQELEPIRLVAGSYAEEAAMHARFAHLRIRWEWFTYHDDMLGDLGLPEWTAPDPLPIELPPITGLWAGMQPEARARALALRQWMAEEGHTVEAVALATLTKAHTVVGWLHGRYPHNRVGANTRLLEFSGGKLKDVLRFTKRKAYVPPDRA